MGNYLYGAGTMFAVTMMINIVNDMIPNDLGYYVGLLMPF